MFHGTKRLSHLGPRIWNLVPDKLKQLSDLYEIKIGCQKTAYVGYVNVAMANVDFI